MYIRIGVGVCGDVGNRRSSETKSYAWLWLCVLGRGEGGSKVVLRTLDTSK